MSERPRPRSGRASGHVCCSRDRNPRWGFRSCALLAPGGPASRRRANLSRVRFVLATTLACATLGMVAATSPGAAERTRPSAPRTMLDLGDSLSVGTDPYLRRQLRGYRIDRLYDVGLHASEAAAIVVRTSRFLPSVLVVSAGTNDDPWIVSAFWRAVSDVLRAAGS